MPRTDAADLPLALSSAQATEAWNGCVRGFLAHAAETPARLGAALAAEPGFALGHAAMGFFQLLLGRRETHEAARAAQARALTAAAEGGGDARTAAYLDALADALDGRLFAGADRLDAILTRWPGDALALKLGHAIRFVLGDAAGMRRSVEAAAAGFGAGHPYGGYALGCHAFALEETGDYAQAEAQGRAGIALAADDAWGLHAVAHVCEMTARPRDGVMLLRGAAGAWAHCNNFGAHVWWHLALFHLDRGAFEPALMLYDARIRVARTDDYRDIANAASLLARLELEGVGVGGRWEELAELAAARVEHGGNVFADLHYLIALDRAGRRAEAARLAARLKADGARGAGDMDAVAGAVGGPVAEGLRLFAEGAHRAAFAKLHAASASLQRIGGSHAQRDVFARLMVAAALKGGLWSEAERALNLRPGLRPAAAADGYVGRRRAEIARGAALDAAHAPALRASDAARLHA